MQDRSTLLAEEVRRRAGQGGAPPAPEERKENNRELMEAAQKGDREAYGQIFQRHAPAIWQMAYLIMHNADSAEDVVQETFTRGLQHIGSFRGESEPKGWLCAIALNVCRQMIRRKRTGEGLADTVQLEEGRPHGPPKRGVLTTLLRHETSRRLALALGFLTEAQREVFVLHYVEGLPYDVIAEILGTTSGAARALSHRARGILKTRLRGDLTDAGAPRRSTADSTAG